MNASTKVDVCVPTRGAAPYLEQTLDSVLAQTFEDWSLLISENGPGGGELEDRIRPYLSDPRMHYSATGGDLGAAQNHTRLIQAGSAPYVGILHDDDRWHPEFLARRVAFLDANPECGFVFGANVEIDEHGSETGRSRIVAPEGLHAPEEFAPRLVKHNVIGIPTMLVRRSAYEAVGPAFDENSLAFDYEMWLRLAFRFPAAYLRVWDSDYRIHAAQATRTTRRRGKERLHVYERTEQLLAGAPSIRVDPGVRRRQLAAAHLIAALDAVEEGESGRARGHLREAVRANPRSVFDTRFAAAVAALALGARGREAFARLRFLVLRKRLRVHLRR
jgi:glycosyltransferase involved in cell wall biosynthesis